MRLRVNKWHGVFQIQFAIGLSPALLIMPGQAVVTGGLSFWGIFAASLIGTTLSLLVALWGTSLGARYGVPGAVGFRCTYGFLGSRFVVSTVRCLASIYWFAFQAIGAAMGIDAILRTWLGWEIGALPLTLGFALLHITFAAVGFQSMQSLSRVIWPLGAFPCVLIVYLLASSGNPRHSLLAAVQAPASNPGLGQITIWIGIYFGMYISAALASADLSRYTVSSAHAVAGFAAASLSSLTVAVLTSAYVGLATGFWNPYSAAGALATNGLVYAVLAVGIFANVLAMNVANVYGAGMALVNIVPRIGRFWSTITTGAVMLAASTMPTWVNDASGWVAEMGNVLCPLVGVFVMDYLIIRRGDIDVDALFDSQGKYRYLGGINPVAVVAAAVGFAFAKAVPPWAMPQVAGLVAAMASYYGATRFGGRYWRGFGISG